MTSEYVRRFVYKRKGSSERDFIEFWAPRYYDPHEERYTENIRGPHTDASFRQLFLWKEGDKYLGLSSEKWKALVANFVSKRGAAAQLPASISAKDFLEKEFPTGGAIYRIFWLHCWYPDRFPIYDQHVHRAMTYIQDGKPDELGKYSEKKVIELYINRYMRFHQPYAKARLTFDSRLDGVRSRKADRALFTFGKCLPTSSLPLLKPSTTPSPK
jgi:hypothetical protein